jgi:prepilin-type N-terminal cleavage/methylation domain-containing protein
MKNKGFTLIELLVVIAVLGILATLIIASLSRARNEAKDVAILAEIQGLKTSVEVETGANGNYTDICNLFDTGEKLAIVRDSIESKGGTWVSCDSDANSYAIVVQLIPQVASADFSQTKIAFAQTRAGSTAAKEDLSNNDIKDVKANSGIHSNTQTVLLSNDAIQRIKKETGRSFNKPRYYCVGALPGNTKGGYREGYLYELPSGGCGNYPSEGDEMSVYENGQNFDPQENFMSQFQNCTASYSEVEAAVANGWIGDKELDNYPSRCPGNGGPSDSGIALAVFMKDFDGCRLSTSDLEAGKKKGWITEDDVQSYNKRCGTSGVK